MFIEHEAKVGLLGQVPLFSHLTPEQLDYLSGMMQVVEFRSGETIFDLGDPSEGMFVVFEGEVTLFSADDQIVASLRQGDSFGEEALIYDDPREYHTVARKRSTLLYFSAEQYGFVDDELLGLDDRLEVIIRSRSLSMRVYLPWLQPGEFIHVITRRHPAFLGWRMVKPILFFIGVLILSLLLGLYWAPKGPYGWITFGVGVLISVFWLVWVLIDWQNDYFIVTNKRVVWIERVALLYDSRQEAPLSTIMSVGMERAQLGRMFEFADVVVMTYVGTIRLRDIGNADVIAGLIESYWYRARTVNRREEAELMTEKLGRKIGFDWNAMGETRVSGAEIEEQIPDTEPETYEEPGFLRWLFSDFIKLHYESSGAIIYRKHWFVLVKDLFLPAALFLFALLLIVWRLGGGLAFLPVTATIAWVFIGMFACFVWAIYQYADWRNDIYKITKDQIIDLDRKPLGKERRRSAPLENILSIEYERLGFWGYLLNFGTVSISVGNTKLTFDYVYNPSEVQQDIFYRMGERLASVREYEIDAERERVSEWIASYHRAIAKDRERHPR